MVKRFSPATYIETIQDMENVLAWWKEGKLWGSAVGKPFEHVGKDEKIPDPTGFHMFKGEIGEYKFNVGDRVKVKGGFTLGTIVGRDNTYVVKWDGSHSTFIQEEKYLEPFRTYEVGTYVIAGGEIGRVEATLTDHRYKVSFADGKAVFFENELRSLKVWDTVVYKSVELKRNVYGTITEISGNIANVSSTFEGSQITLERGINVCDLALSQQMVNAGWKHGDRVKLVGTEVRRSEGHFGVVVNTIMLPGGSIMYTVQYRDKEGVTSYVHANAFNLIADIRPITKFAVNQHVVIPRSGMPASVIAYVGSDEVRIKRWDDWDTVIVREEALQDKLEWEKENALNVDEDYWSEGSYRNWNSLWVNNTTRDATRRWITCQQIELYKVVETLSDGSKVEWPKAKIEKHNKAMKRKKLDEQIKTLVKERDELNAKV